MNKEDIMYNYMNDSDKNKLIQMLIRDGYTIGDVLRYVDKLMGEMYNLGYEDRELHA